MDTTPDEPQGTSTDTSVRTVFVVEDDAATRDSIAALLGAQGYPVRAYPSTAAFLAAADEELAGGCLILDGRLEEVSCFEVLDALRHRNLRMPTVLFTGLPESALAQDITGYDEVVALLRKPLGGSALVSTVQKAFGGRE